MKAKPAYVEVTLEMTLLDSLSSLQSAVCTGDQFETEDSMTHCFV